MGKYLDDDACEEYLSSPDPLEGLTLTVAEAEECMTALLSVGRGMHVLGHATGMDEGDLHKRLETVHRAYEAIKTAIHRQMHRVQDVPCLDPDDIRVCLGDTEKDDPYAGKSWAKIDVGDHLTG